MRHHSNNPIRNSKLVAVEVSTSLSDVSEPNQTATFILGDITMYERHGHALHLDGKTRNTREYKTWCDMKFRCMNPNYHHYKNWGGRGIKVCDEWLDSFSNFLQYIKDNNMFPKPNGLTLERINNDGNYEPGNIRWATHTEQNRNRRASQRKLKEVA
jgi:hypothetical protein